MDWKWRMRKCKRSFKEGAAGVQEKEMKDRED